MLSFPEADAQLFRRHETLLIAERRRRIEQAAAQIEQASRLARLRCAAQRFVATTGATLPRVRSANRPDPQADLLPGSTVIGG
jgi:hypothetical protein